MIKFLRKILKSPFKLCLRFYFGLRQIYPIWFYVLNRRRRAIFRARPHELDDLSQRILKEFKETGIAVVHLDDLFPGENIFPILKGDMERLREQAQVETAKTFLKYLWDDVPVLKPDNNFLKIALRTKILNIVNSYLGLSSNFYYFTLNVTTPMAEGAEAKQSQKWHRDPEDKKMCKIFIYLTDVDEKSGPFIYLKGSHYGGSWNRLFPQQPPKGVYPPPGEIERIVSKADLRICTGRAGTLIFCDTAGLHKGGYATAKERVMFTAGYCTAASPRALRYVLPNDVRELNRSYQVQDHLWRRSIPAFPGYLLKRFRKLIKEY